VTPVLLEFVTFFLLISSLYIVQGGGLKIYIGFRGTPWVNVIFLLFFESCGHDRRWNIGDSPLCGDESCP
jgi:hypothetical protein